MIYKIALVLALGLLISFTENKQERKLRFEFTENQVNVILNGLNELPAKTANPIIQEIYQQVQKQLQDTIKKK